MSAPTRRRPTREQAQLVGHRRNAAGDGLEGMLARWHACYRLLREAVITKGNPAVYGTPGAMSYGEPSDVDYTGLARRPGLHVVPVAVPLALDAKSCTDRASYAPPSPGRGTKAELLDYQRDVRQLEFLRDWQRAGGLAFLLLYCRRLELAWLLFDVQALLSGRAVPIRSLDGKGGRVDHLPVVPAGSVLSIARGRPAHDYLPVALQAAGFLPAA